MSIGSRRWPTAALLAALLWPGHSHAADDFSRAQALERAGDYSQAQRHYRQYLAGQPFSVDKRIAKTRLAILQKGLQAPGDAGLAPYLNALVAREDGDYDSAIKHLQSLLRRHPDSLFAADARYLLGYIELMDRFDYARANEQMQRVAESTDAQYRDTAQYSQAIALEQLGQLDAARRAFVEIRDRHAVIASDLLDLYLARGNFQSRFWFSRASRRIDAIDQFKTVQRDRATLLGGDFSLAIGARYHYDQPVGSGAQYRYLWHLLEQHQLPATHLTHWYTRGTDWRWESDAPLRAAAAAGLTPVISHWWFGDDISPAFVRDQRAAYLYNIEHRLVPVLENLPDAIVLLEPEFNKRGIERWAQWDAIASEAIELIKRAAPQVRVGLVVGDWAAFDAADALDNIDSAVAKSDFVGFMLMTSAGNESADLNPVWSVRERAQRAAHALQQRFEKPLYFAYMALSSADHYRLRQAEYLRQLLDYAPMLASYGVFGIGYFSLHDNPRQRGWFGAAENHFGLLQADGADKPAANAWREAASALMRADKTAPALDRKFRFDRHLDGSGQRYEFSAGFGEWVRWRVELEGQTSGAGRHFRGAGKQFAFDWRGEAERGQFGNETVTATLQASDKGGNRIVAELELEHDCRPACTRVRRVTADADYARAHGALNGASVTPGDDGQLQIELPRRHSAVTLALPDISAGDHIRLQLDTADGAEGLRIGLIDRHHYQTDLPVEMLIDGDGGWQSITVAVADFPANARRFGRGGKQVQFGELQIDASTRLLIQQRLRASTVRIRHIAIARVAGAANHIGANHADH